jgi:uncharacterized protein (DUF4415 family)
MNANNQNFGSDMARVNAHEIQAQEYDELPELTKADLERGVWKIAGKEVTPAEGKAAFCSALKKQKINITLDPDVLGWYRAQAGGRGYQTLINATLREAMTTHTIEDTVRKVIREELHRRY